MEGLETKTVENIVSLIPAESLHLLVPLDSKWGVIASKRLNSYVCGQVVLVVQGQKVQISGMRCHMLTGEVLPWKGVADFSDEDLEQTTISSIVITGNVADPPQLNLCAYAYDRSLQDAGFRSGLLRFLKLCRISTTAEIRVEELSADVGRLLIDALRSGFQRVFVRKLNFDLHLFFDRMLKSSQLSTVVISHCSSQNYLTILLKYRKKSLNYLVFEEPTINTHFVRDVLHWWNNCPQLPHPIRIKFVAPEMYKFQGFFTNMSLAKRFFNQPSEGACFVFDHPVEHKGGRPLSTVACLRRTELEMKLTCIPGL